MRRKQAVDRKPDMLEQLVRIGDQLEAATSALRSLVLELRADLPEHLPDDDDHPIVE